MSPGAPDSLELHGDRLRNLDLEGFSNLRVLVAGDFMLDEYLWGKVERISPEAPVAVVEVERETRTLGGAGNVVNNLVALGAQVEVLGLVGDDNPGHLLKQEMVRLGVGVDGLFTDPARRTSRKTRVIGASQQVVRIDRETRTPGPPAFETAAREFLQARLPRVHALVLSDYAKGVLTPTLLQELIAQGAKVRLSRGGGPQRRGLLRLRRGHGDHPQPQGSRAGRGLLPGPAGGPGAGRRHAPGKPRP